MDIHEKCFLHLELNFGKLMNWKFRYPRSVFFGVGFGCHVLYLHSSLGNFFYLMIRHGYLDRTYMA